MCLAAMRGEGIEPTNHGKTVVLTSFARCDFLAFAHSVREDPPRADLALRSVDDRLSVFFEWTWRIFAREDPA
ncbi:hypothetical protein EA473_00310 [Natrarchaeobius chitinivorans]|uniref:Uncharacterized protein n=1 Tax=Natrarchaeobius chitinivorans TaxID=1679083 RepID=A0A3N6PDH1_NATCH|nr:hypothetical protein EA473_00310 [Natrarchaeobius chitinivorans]